MKEISKEILLESITDSGKLSASLLFLNVFGFYPNTYVFNLRNEHRMNLLSIDSEEINKMFPDNLYYWKTASESAQSTSAVDDCEEEDDIICIGSQFSDAAINVVTNDFIWSIYGSQIIVYYANKSIEEIKDAIKNIIGIMPIKEQENRAAKVELICSDGRGYYTMTSSIKSTTVDIDATYNDNFKEESDKVINFLTSRESGLVLLHGKAGSGKTTYIRHLITNVPNEYIIVPSNIMPYIASQEFSEFLMSHKNSVFILEDCESLLMDRGVSFNTGISSILNLSDGLLSDIFNLKFICTFNADTTMIDAALMRPGRCYANYEFGPLCKEKVEKLIEENKLESVEPKEMLLAELFNGNPVESEVESNTSKKIGF